MSHKTISDLEELLPGFRHILAKKEAAYQLLSTKSDISEIEDIDGFLLDYIAKISTFSEKMKEHDFNYTVQLILKEYEQGKYFSDNQLEALFWLIGESEWDL